MTDCIDKSDDRTTGAAVGAPVGAPVPTPQSDRQYWMSVLARAPGDAIRHCYQALTQEQTSRLPGFEHIRAPEIGMIMTRGRAGGTGAQFNLGEVTATRCSIRLESGEVGHAYATGRDKEKAELSAYLDALLQTELFSGPVRDHVIVPLATEAQARQAETRKKAAATKVEFFTMVRGEDE